MGLAEFEHGTVWITGAGPGDPGLLTLAAAHGLGRADVVLYDALVSEGVLAHVRDGAALEFVGKRCGRPSMTQPQITARIIAHARSGARVVRLKGGDPLTFARGAEEALALAAAGVHFRIIPGVSAGVGGLAAAGIPLTHRDCNTVVSFITGHDASGALPSDIDWRALAASSPAIVCFMAVRTLPQIAANLMAAGRDAGEPVAIVRAATLPDQVVVETTLGEAARGVRGVRSPAIVAIGPIVALREILSVWQLGAEPEGAVEGQGQEREQSDA